MTQGRVQARVFGEVADDYDRLRAGYPPEMVDEVFRYAGNPPTALEIGAGTGKATRAFAGRGINITATEPDPAMAAVLRRSAPDNVTVLETPFEEFQPAARFELLYSAQAWHWVDPATRWERAAAALKTDGTIALFWNLDRLADSATLAEVTPVYQRHAPELTPNADLAAEDELATEWPGPDLAALPTFGDVETYLYRWERRLRPVDYLNYLSTQSPYRMLDDTVRGQLFGGLRDVIDDEIAVGVDTVLYLARRTAE